MQHIHSISVKTNAGADFYLQLGDFLDSFYKMPPDERAAMLEVAPDDMAKP